jgi:hypothetical protein
MFSNFQKGVKGDVELSRRLNKDLLYFNDYVALNKEEILKRIESEKESSVI